MTPHHIATGSFTRRVRSAASQPRGSGLGAGGQRDLLSDVAYCLEHDLCRDRFGHRCLELYGLGSADSQIAAELHRRAARHQYEAALGMAGPFRDPHLPSRELILSARDGAPSAGIPLSLLLAGTLLIATTGGGKTTLIEFLLLQITAFVDSIWMTDLYKKRLRHLRPFLGRVGKDLVILNHETLRLNPLQAEGCDPRTHLTLVVDLLQRSLDLPPRAVTIIRQACLELYDRFGVFRQERPLYPTLFDLYEHVRSAPRLNPAAREAILDRLGALLTSLSAECLAYRRAWSPLDLSRRMIVFELRGLSEPAKSLVLSHCIFSVFHAALERGRRASGLEQLIVLEDAQRILAGRASTSADLPPLEELVGVVRESGRGLLFSAQTMAGLPRGIAANTNLKIMGALGRSEDYAALGGDMGMDREQIAWAKQNLRPGRFIGQVGLGNWRRPFLLEIPPVHVPATVSDEDARDSVQALADLELVPATEFMNWTPYASVSVDTNQSPAPAASNGDAEEGPDTGGNDDLELDEAELRFLRAVVEHPGEPSSHYAKYAHLNTSRAAAIRKRLVERGYLRLHSVATGRRGRKSLVVEPLEPALRGVEANADQGGN
ncbi:MAG: hypothetical protein KAS72_11145 [Phycisphaerales bacterium]|nr:hypothetical protein [Phycisphaerales bacterium]